MDPRNINEGDLRINLAACSNTVSFWSLPERSKIHELDQDFGKVTSSTWCSDGSILATASSVKPDHISLTYVKNEAFSTTEILGPLGPKFTIRAMQFPRASKRLLCVASSDQVFLYDISAKGKKVKQEFRKVPNVTCLSVGHKNEIIAAGNQDGQLYFLKPLIGRVTDPIKVSDGSSLTCVKFNTQLPWNNLGTSDESGTVTFWDVNRLKVLKKFSEHNAPATGIAYSPINDLSVSCGLDKRCHCYDPRVNKPVATISTNLPLTCVEFAPDGQYLIFGTTQGLVQIYSLNKFDKPVMTLEQSSTNPITTVSFQPDKMELSQVSSIFERLSMSSATSSMVKENIQPAYAQPDEANASLGSQVFSPLRDVGSSFQSPNVHATTPIGEFHLSRSSRMSSESILSPLRETSFNMASPVFNPASSVGKKFSTTPLLSSIREEGVDKSFESMPPNQLNQSPFESRPSNQLDPDQFGSNLIHPSSSSETPKRPIPREKAIIISESTPFFLPINSVSSESEVQSTSKAKNLSLDSNSENIRAILTAFPQALESPAAMTQSNSGKAAQPQEKEAKKDAFFDGFKREFVQAVVEEAMDEYATDMRKQMWHLHLDMIKYFIQQEDRMKKMLQENNINQGLLEEVKRLRLENEKLKNTPFVLANSQNDEKEADS